MRMSAHRWFSTLVPNQTLGSGPSSRLGVDSGTGLPSSTIVATIS
jgi:hypothetical protein